MLASDYDGTITGNGTVTGATQAALDRVASTGRRIVLVTGRLLEELLRIFPGAQRVDRIVAENGAVLHSPADGRTRLLAPPLDPRVPAELARRGVTPLSAGRVICAGTEPHHAVIREVLVQLGSDSHIILNKGAVMVLPRGVDKGSGLTAALQDLGEVRAATVGVGDAENDLALLAAAGMGVAVANAIPALRDAADIVLQGAAGEGVQELINALVADDLGALAAMRRPTSA